MASIRAQQANITILRREAQATWIAACNAAGVDPSSKFVVFDQASPEAEAHNKAMHRLFMAQRHLDFQLKRNQARRDKHAVYTSCGMQRVRGVNGGVYYE